MSSRLCHKLALIFAVVVGVIMNGVSAFADANPDPVALRCTELLQQLVRPSKPSTGDLKPPAESMIDAARANLKEIVGEDSGKTYQLKWRYELDSHHGKVVFGFRHGGKEFGVELPLSADIKNRNTIYVGLPRDDAKNLIDLNLLFVVLETINQKVSSEFKFKIIIEDPQTIELLNDALNKIYLESGDLSTPARRISDEDENIFADLDLVDHKRDSVFSGVELVGGDDLLKRMNADKDVQSLIRSKMEESDFFRTIQESTDWVGHFELERSFMPHDLSETEGKEVIYPFHWVLSLEAIF